MQFILPFRSSEDYKLNQPYARKIFRLNNLGEWESEQNHMATLWVPGSSDAESIGAIYHDLKKAAEAGCVMIHGTVIAKTFPMVRRSSGDDATIVDKPSRWLAIDIDSTTVPLPDCESLEACREWWVTSNQDDFNEWYREQLFPKLGLPQSFANVKVILHLSASAFLKNQYFRGHLFFHLSDPVSVRYWKHELASSRADVSKYSPEHVLYLANPGFRGKSPWESYGPHYAWRIVREGADCVQVGEEALTFVPPPSKPYSYIPPANPLPKFLIERWWKINAIEEKIREARIGDRHNLMQSLAVRIAKAISKYELDESVWPRFEELWIDKGKSQKEIVSCIKWACSQ